MELQIIEQVEPVVTVNFEEMKQYLQGELKKYEDLIVTDDTKADGKKIRAELNGNRKKVDDYRKDIKKQMSAPIVAFENKCKELLALFDKVLGAIDIQLKEIEDRRKEKKRSEVNVLMTKVITEYELDEKHAALLPFDERYLNETFKLPKVEVDL